MARSSDDGPMKVWPNRLPVSMIEAWAARARKEGVTGSALLRHVMAEALARTDRIMPLPEVETNGCEHDGALRQVGYTRLCSSCGAVVV